MDNGIPFWLWAAFAHTHEDGEVKHAIGASGCLIVIAFLWIIPLLFVSYFVLGSDPLMVMFGAWVMGLVVFGVLRRFVE